MTKEHEVDLNLLKEFPPPTYEEWKQTVIEALKGADFDRVMNTKTYEGITLKPIYRAEDAQRLAHLSAAPGQAPYARGKSETGYLEYGWVVAQAQDEPSLAKANTVLLDELNRGLNSVYAKLNPSSRECRLPSANDANSTGLPLSHLSDMDVFMSGVDLQAVPYIMMENNSTIIQLALLNAYARKNSIPLRSLCGCVSFDPISQSYLAMDEAKSLPSNLEYLYQMAKWADQKAPRMRTILIDGAVYQNHGASAIQELGYVLSSGAMMIDAMLDRGLSIAQIAARVVIRLGVGANFFMEIAKIRAARMLWSELIKAYGGSETDAKVWIHAVTTDINKSEYDVWVNLLRTTIESFSAVMGGADSIETGCFDASVRQSDEFSRRIARNQQLVLAEEAHFQKVVDPAGGCWYIECLTAEIANSAWKLMQETEASGGMASVISSCKIKQDLNKTMQSRKTAVNSRRDVVVGVNMFANPDEKVLEPKPADPKWLDEAMQRYATQKLHAEAGLEESLNMIKEDRGNDLIVDMICDAFIHGADIEQVSTALGIVPLNPSSDTQKITSDIEGLRKAVETSRATAKRDIMLLNMGPIATHKARADFSLGFFQVAGFDVINSNGFATADEAVSAVFTSRPAAVCICSTDDEYITLVPELMQKLSALPHPPITILAGYPVDMVDKYRESGIQYFIHLKANAYETLSAIAKQMGVEQ